MKDTIGIVGLGLIGGSLAKAIKRRTEYRVLGLDIQKSVVSLAAEEGMIDGELNETSFGECFMIIIALYPGDVISFLRNNMAKIRSGTIVVDCAGVKTRILEEVSGCAKANGVRFVGGHPMAGATSYGYRSSFAELFDGACMILCKEEDTDYSAISEVSSFFTGLGFGRVKITTAAEHDEIIAYTSQLAHIVSSAYVQSNTINKRVGFSAGSFKDLSRVAKLDEEMWTELFFENRWALLEETDNFIENMLIFRNALASRDKDAMKELLRKGAEIKIRDDEEGGDG